MSRVSFLLNVFLVAGTYVLNVSVNVKNTKYYSNRLPGKSGNGSLGVESLFTHSLAPFCVKSFDDDNWIFRCLTFL